MIKGQILSGLGLSFGLIGFVETGATVEPIQFKHSCGAGCSSSVQMTSKVQTVRGVDGRVWKAARFLESTTGSRGNPDATTAVSRVVHGFADCTRKQVVVSESRVPPTKVESWQQLSGNYWDYSGPTAGRGQYFDALCATRQ